MDVETEVLQQLAPLGRVGLAVASDVVDGLGQDRRRALDAHQPAGGVADFVEHRASTAHGFSGVIADERDFAEAGVEVRVLEARSLREDVLDGALGVLG